MTSDRKPVWVAQDSTGIAHARDRANSTRTLCSEPALPQRYAWPSIAKCRLCRVVLERAAVAPSGKEAATA